MSLTPDPLLSWPLQCRFTTPYGVVDLGARLPRRGGVTLTDVPAEELRQISERTGLDFGGAETSVATEWGGDCPPPDAQGSHTVSENTVTKADGSTETTTVETVKTINPDGSVTTTTTTTKSGTDAQGNPLPPTTATASNTGALNPPRPASVLITVTLELGAEFALIRPLTKCRVGDVITLAENYTDRHTLRLWVNATVHEPPTWPFQGHANGAEFYGLNLKALIVGGRP